MSSSTAASPLMRAASWRPSALFMQRTSSSVSKHSSPAVGTSSPRNLDSSGTGQMYDDSDDALAEVAEKTEFEMLIDTIVDTEAAARQHEIQTFYVIRATQERRFRSGIEDIIHKERRAALNRFSQTAATQGLEAATGKVDLNAATEVPSEVLAACPWKTPMSGVKPILKKQQQRLSLSVARRQSTAYTTATTNGGGGDVPPPRGLRRQLMAMRGVTSEIDDSPNALMAAASASQHAAATAPNTTEASVHSGEGSPVALGRSTLNNKRPHRVAFSKFLHIVPIPPRQILLHEDLDDFEIVPYDVEGGDDATMAPYDAELVDSEDESDSRGSSRSHSRGSGGETPPEYGVDGVDGQRRSRKKRRPAKDAPMPVEGVDESALLHDVLARAVRRPAGALQAAMSSITAVPGAPSDEDEDDSENDVDYSKYKEGGAAQASGDSLAATQSSANQTRRGGVPSPRLTGGSPGRGDAPPSFGKAERFNSPDSLGGGPGAYTGDASRGSPQSFNRGYIDGSTVFGLRKDAHIARKSFRHQLQQEREAEMLAEAEAERNEWLRVSYVNTVSLKEDRELYDKAMSWLSDVLARRPRREVLHATPICNGSAANPADESTPLIARPPTVARRSAVAPSRGVPSRAEALSPRGVRGATTSSSSAVGRRSTADGGSRSSVVLSPADERQASHTATRQSGTRSTSTSGAPSRAAGKDDIEHRNSRGAPWPLSRSEPQATAAAAPAAAAALMLEAGLREVEEEGFTPPPDEPHWDGWTEPDSILDSGGFQWRPAEDPNNAPRRWRAMIDPKGADARRLAAAQAHVAPGSEWRRLSEVPVTRVGVPTQRVAPKRRGLGDDVSMLTRTLTSGAARGAVATPPSSSSDATCCRLPLVTLPSAATATAAATVSARQPIGIAPPPPPDVDQAKVNSIVRALVVDNAQPPLTSTPLKRSCPSPRMTVACSWESPAAIPLVVPSPASNRCTSKASPRVTPRTVLTQGSKAAAGDADAVTLRKSALFAELEELLQEDERSASVRADSSTLLPSSVKPPPGANATSPKAGAGAHKGRPTRRRDGAPSALPAPPPHRAAVVTCDVPRFVPRPVKARHTSLGVSLRDLETDESLRQAASILFAVV